MKKFIQLILCLVLIPIASQSQEIVLKGKQLFGDITARHIGPANMSGRITDIEMHPTNTQVIYIGAAGGGVWKSNDAGATFNPIFDDNIQSIGTVTLDPNSPDNTIWVGTGEIWTRNSVSIGDGIYKSTDGGSNWKKMGLENSERIASIVVDPNDSNTVYVGVLGALWSDSEERGVYKTTDGGKTWTKILYINPLTGAGDVILDPKNSNILYASMWEFRRTPWSFNSGGENSAIYKSTDAGKTWNKITNGLPSGELGRIGLALAPSNNNLLYAVIETGKKETNGLWKSPDAGKTWEHLNSDFGLTVRPFYFSRIVVDPNNPNVIVKAGLQGYISRDGGKTFKTLGNMHSDIHDITFDVKNSDIMYCATDGGFYRSWDKGNVFEICEDLPLSQFYHISVDDAEPYNVYGGLQDNGSWYGPSSSGGGISGGDWKSVGYGDGFRVLKHPTKNIIYSEMQGAQSVWRFDVDKKRVRTIQPLRRKRDPKLRFNWNAPMAVSIHQPNRFYMGSQFLHKSEDMGETWTIISPDLTTNDKTKQNQVNSGGLSRDNSGAENYTNIFTIAESPLDEKVIWVGTDDGNIQVTRNGGKTWDNVTTNLIGIPSQTWVYHIEASVHNKGTAFAVFDGHTKGDMKPYALKTTDFGKTWTSIISPDIDKKAFVRSIQEDYENTNLLFLGTEKGLYITINGGKNWSLFTNNMPLVAIHFIDLQKQTNDLVMGTHGRGVIIIDDISPLRELNQNILAENVHFFKTKPFIMYEDQGGFGNGFGGETAFVGRSKNRNARFVYYLKKRHTFGKMKMEIQDLKGNKIVSLSPGKSKGLNIVTWNFHTQVPKMAEGKTLSFGGFTSPRVSAGKYKMVLTKGKKTYEQVFEVKYDDKSITTLPERKEQEALTQNLFVMVEDLAYMVHQINQTLTNADEAIKTNPKTKKTAQKLIEKLQALKEDLVVTTGDMYVDSAEPELRERMGDLYSSVAGNYDRITATQKENYELISEEFNLAKQRYAEIMKKEGNKFLKLLTKYKLPAPAIKSKTDFLKKD